MLYNSLGYFVLILTDSGDATRCFHCGVTVHRWMPGDDVFFDHVRWSPNCYFMRYLKGEKYVQETLDKITKEDAEKIAMELNITLRSDNSPSSATAVEAAAETDNTEMDISRKCKICLDRDLQIVSLPCGHLITCAQCAAAIEYCSICREIIMGYVRVFM